MVKSLKSLLSGCLIISMLIITPGCSNLDIQTLNNKAAQLMEQGDIDGAIARLESIQDLNPNFPITNFNLGIAYQKKDNKDKAIHYLKKSIELKPDLYQASIALAIAYEQLSEELISQETEKYKKETKKTVHSIDELEFSKEQKDKLVNYFNNSKLYYEQYLKYNKHADDKEAISMKLKGIDNSLSKLSGEIINSTEEQN